MHKTHLPLLLSSLLLFSCTQTPTPSTEQKVPTISEWKFEKTIAEPLTEKIEGAKTLGSLEKNKITVTIPEKTFDTPTEVTVKNPDKLPSVDTNMFTPLGAPVEIDSSQRRLNSAMEITFAIPEASETDLKNNKIWAFYFNGKTWDAIKPFKQDITQKTITFHSYHMSFWGKGKVSVEQRVAEYTKSKTLGEMAQEKTDEVVDKIVENAVDHLLRVQLGMNDESVKYKVMSSLMNDDDYAEILDAFRRGEAAEFNQKLQVFMGKKIAENVEKEALAGALKTLSSKEGVEYAEAAAQALGYLYEGDLKGAAEILGGKIADTFLITKLFKAGIEIVQYNINLWKDKEIESAYQAYKNGADGYFWGYNVDKGDFESVYNQMKGIAVRLESEYVQREIERRANLGLREATDAELNAIREQVKQDLEEQFKTRLSKEDELAKEEAKLKTLIDAFTKAKLLDHLSFGYDENDQTLEERLDNLLNNVQKILKDTGRKNWTTNTFGDKENLSMNDLVSLVQAINSGEEEVYTKMLKEKFGTNLAGASIQGNFTLIAIGDPPTNSWQSQISFILTNKTKIEVKDGKFNTNVNQIITTTDGPIKFTGNGWLQWSGTYDSSTGMLKIQSEYGWDGETQGNTKGKERIVYTCPIKEVKITPDMKIVSIDLMGTITATRSSENKDGTWGKPWTSTNQGGGVIPFNVEID